MKNKTLLLAALAIVGVIAVGAFLLLSSVTPQSALKNAAKFFEEGDYYKMEEESEYTMAYLGQSQSFTATAKTSVDLKNGNKHEKQTSTSGGQSTTQETYTIGDKTYTKTGSSDWQESNTEKDPKMFVTALTNIVDDGAYEILEEQTVDGKESFHYKADIKGDILEEMEKSMKKAMVETDGISYSSPKIENCTLELWVSKSDQKVIKAVIAIDEIKISMTNKATNESIDFTMEDMSVTTMFSDYGVENKIEKPS